MRRTLPALLVCGLILAATLLIALLPGAVRFQAGTVSVDAATPVIVFAALLALLLLGALGWLLGALFALPRRVRTRRAIRRQRDGEAAVTSALVAIAAGHQSDALRNTARARQKLGDTPHTLLLSGEANHLAGRHADAARHFDALANHPDAALLGLRGLHRLALDRGDHREAADLLDRAARAHPSSPWVRDRRASLPLALPALRERPGEG